MVVKLLKIEVFLPGCSSLKEKRFVLSSLKTKLRRKFNISVAEVAYHDKWQRCLLAVVTVGVDGRVTESACDKVLRFIEDDYRIQITDVQQEYC